MAEPTKLIGASGAVVVLGLMLAACSLASPTDRTFTTADTKQAKQPDKTTIEEASKNCKEQTRAKGFNSVLAIVSRLRPGAVDQDYIACMKGKGYTVAK